MKKQNNFSGRLLLLLALIGLVFVCFGVRLMSVQIVHGEEYKEKVQQGVTYRQQVEPSRGEILDCYGRPFIFELMFPVKRGFERIIPTQSFRKASA